MIFTGSSRRGLQAMASPLSSHSGDNSEEPALSRDQGSYRGLFVCPHFAVMSDMYMEFAYQEKTHY